MLVAFYKTLIAIVFSVISVFAPFLSNVVQTDFVPLDAEKVNLTFAAISDTHINEDESRLFLLKLGLSDMQNAEHPLDAFVLSGDVTHHAYEEHWSMLKKGFDKYFKDLNDDVNIMTDISTLPTSTVNKVGLIVASSVLGLSGLSALAIILLKRKSF